MFKGFWKRLAKIVIISAVGAMAGPLGAAIATAAMANWRGGATNPYVEGVIDRWTEEYFVPYYTSLMAKMSTKIAPERVNEILEELYAYIAYYQFREIQETDEDEILIAQAKASLIEAFTWMVRDAWYESGGTGAFHAYPFNPLKYNKIGLENLDWNGVKSVEATKHILAAKPYDGGGTGGGTGTGTGTGTGGGTTTGGGGVGTQTGGGTGTGTGTGGGTTTGGGGVGTQTGGGTGTGPGTGTGGGNQQPMKPLAYFKLEMHEKAIFNAWWEEKSWRFYNQYRKENPSYKPSNELLTLLGIPIPAATPRPQTQTQTQPPAASHKKTNPLLIVGLAIGAVLIFKKKNKTKKN